MSRPRLSVLGGTGRFGLGLAWRLALSGAEVHIGSRDPGRAAEAAARLREKDAGGLPAPPKGGLTVYGATNRDAAEIGDPVFLSVPFAAQDALLEEVGSLLQSKLVISCGVIWPPGSRPETSAAEEAERVLRGSGAGKARVAAAFQTVAAAVLRRPPGRASPETSPDVPDVLVFADEVADRAAAAEAAGRSGLRAVPVGALARSRAAEAALGMLMDLNRGSARHAGFAVTGIRRSDPERA